MKSLCSIKTNKNGIHYFVGYKFPCGCGIGCGAIVTILEIDDTEIKGLLVGGPYDGEISFCSPEEIK